MLSITEAAGEFIRQSANEGGIEGLALRVAAQRKDSGEIEYTLGFDEPDGESDIAFSSAGVKLIIGPAYADLLQNCVMDYAEIAPGEKRLIFLNPNDPNYVPPTEAQGDVPPSK